MRSGAGPKVKVIVSAGQLRGHNEPVRVPLEQQIALMKEQATLAQFADQVAVLQLSRGFLARAQEARADGTSSDMSSILRFTTDVQQILIGAQQDGALATELQQYQQQLASLRSLLQREPEEMAGLQVHAQRYRDAMQASADRTVDRAVSSALLLIGQARRRLADLEFSVDQMQRVPVANFTPAFIAMQSIELPSSAEAVEAQVLLRDCGNLIDRATAFLGNLQQLRYHSLTQAQLISELQGIILDLDHVTGALLVRTNELDESGQVTAEVLDLVMTIEEAIGDIMERQGILDLRNRPEFFEPAAKLHESGMVTLASSMPRSSREYLYFIGLESAYQPMTMWGMAAQRQARSVIGKQVDVLLVYNSLVHMQVSDAQVVALNLRTEAGQPITTLQELGQLVLDFDVRLQAALFSVHSPAVTADLAQLNKELDAVLPPLRDSDVGHALRSQPSIRLEVLGLPRHVLPAFTKEQLRNMSEADIIHQIIEPLIVSNPRGDLAKLRSQWYTLASNLRAYARNSTPNRSYVDTLYKSESSYARKARSVIHFLLDHLGFDLQSSPTPSTPPRPAPVEPTAEEQEVILEDKLGVIAKELTGELPSEEEKARFEAAQASAVAILESPLARHSGYLQDQVERYFDIEDEWTAASDSEARTLAAEKLDALLAELLARNTTAVALDALLQSKSYLRMLAYEGNGALRDLKGKIEKALAVVLAELPIDPRQVEDIVHALQDFEARLDRAASGGAAAAAGSGVTGVGETVEAAHPLQARVAADVWELIRGNPRAIKNIAELLDGIEDGRQYKRDTLVGIMRASGFTLEKNRGGSSHLNASINGVGRNIALTTGSSNSPLGETTALKRFLTDEHAGAGYRRTVVTP